jgi:hypothetical protein
MTDQPGPFDHAMRAELVEHHEAARGFDLDDGTDVVVLHLRAGGSDHYFRLRAGQAEALAVGLHLAAHGQPPVTE